MKLLCIFFIALSLSACDRLHSRQPQSDSGVTKAHAVVQTGSDGLTIEQRNVHDRLTLDNKPGSIKHLYIISAYSGQTIIYSTVKGKVTSSGKRLTPNTVHIERGTSANGFSINFGGDSQWTAEVLQDDGTYGSSVEYLFWWDVQGRYHQHYVSGGQIIHISDQPIPVKSITINMELSK